MDDVRPDRDEAAWTLRHEYGMVRSAIEMVASGGAPRISLSGLQFGEELLGPARDMARRAGVRVVPLYGADDAGADIRVERLDDERRDAP